MSDPKGVWNEIALDTIGKIAVSLGAMVRRGELTKAENDTRMCELLAWDRGEADEPAWVKDLTQGKPVKVSPFRKVDE